MLRYLFALILLLLAPLALADSEARLGNDWVRITALPCANETVIGLLTAAGEDPTDYRAASAEFQGKLFNLCWKPMFQRELILLRYEDGDAGMIPFGELKPLKEA